MRLLIACGFLLLSLFSHAERLVVVQPLSELLLRTIHSAPAQVVNDEHATISARISSVVESVNVAVGDQVTAGQVLVGLDCSDYTLARQQADSALKNIQAQIKLARQQLSRAEKLLQQKNASIVLRDQRRAELDSLVAQQQGALASVNESQLAIERCTIKAPFAGVVTERMVSTGNQVNAGVPLFKLLALAAQEVKAELTSEQVAGLQKAQEIYFRLDHNRYPIALRTILPFLDNRARTQQVRLRFVEQTALSGSSGRVEWLDSRGRVPARFMVFREGKLGIMRVQQGKADFVLLPNAIEGQAAEVPLAADSLIITQGQHAVEQGEAVQIADAG